MWQSVRDRGITLVRKQVAKAWRLRQDTALEESLGQCRTGNRLTVTPAFSCVNGQSLACWLKPKFYLARHVRRVELVRVELCQNGGRRTSYSARLYSFVVFILLHTQILFVPSDEIKLNKCTVYSNKLVNNLHIISLYKLHNELSCMSSWSCRAVLFDKLDAGKNAWAWHVERVQSCLVETWRAKWNLGLIA